MRDDVLMRLSKRSPLAGIVMAVCLLAVVRPVAARITRTNPRPSETFSPFLPLTLGGGVEWQQDSDTTQWDFPFLFEYTFSEQFKITIEPNYSYIKPRIADEDLRTVNGFGDLETSFEYEFLRERRYRPALTLEGVVKWPSASDPDLGDPGTDYGIGLIASKDFVYFDLDLEPRYTFIGAAGVEYTVSVPFERFTDLKARIEARRLWWRGAAEWSYFEAKWKPKAWKTPHRFLFIRTRVKQQGCSSDTEPSMDRPFRE